MLTRQLRFDDDERAVLRALGYTPRQLLREQAVRAGAIAVAGAALAVGIAYLASSTFPIGFAKSVEPFPGRRFDGLALLVGAVGVALLATAWVVGSAAAATIGRSAVGPTERPGVVDRVAPSLPGWRASTALRFAFNPTAGSARAGRLPLLGLTVIATILTGALTFGANLGRVVTDPATWGQDFDAGVGQGEDQVDPQLVDALSASRDVAGLTLFGLTSLRLGARSLDVVGMQPVKGHLVPEVVQGRMPTTDDEVALGPRASRELHAGIGDRIAGVAARGHRSLTVTGIAIIPGINGADVLGRNALVTFDGFRRLDADQGFGSASVDFADRPGASARLRKLLGGNLGQLDPPSEIGTLRRVRAIPWIVAAAIGSLVVLSLGHLMLAAVRRRRRDFAVLRAVGATQRWLDGVVHWQATLSTGLVLLVAGPLGGLAGAALFRRFVEHIGARPGAGIPLARIALVLFALVVLANAVAALAARRLRRQPLTEALNPG